MAGSRWRPSWRDGAAVLLAASALALVLTPASVWRQPGRDAVYRGFDPVLIYKREMGAGAEAPGIVSISRDELRLVAPPDSLPTAHLLTTPLDKVDMSMELLPLHTAPGGDPLAVSFWNARTGSGVVVRLGPPPAMRATAQAIIGGATRSSLVGGQVVAEKDLGPYSPGVPMALDLSYDRRAGTILVRLRGQEAPPTGSRMLRLSGGPGDPSYRDAATVPVAVAPGHRYRLSALVRVVDGSDAYKLTLQWLDEGRRHIDFSGDWRSVRSLAGWTEVDVVADAPADARWARVYLGSGRATHLLYADVALRDLTTGATLPINGSFDRNAAGWELPGGGLAAVVDPHPTDEEFVVARGDVPGIFHSLRNTVTVTAGASGGTAEAVVRSLTIALPHQRYYGLRVDDPRARLALAAVAGLAILLVVPSAAGLLRRLAHLRPPPSVPTGLLLGGAVLVALMALVAGLGSHPFDMGAARVWTYVAATRPLQELYYLPNLVPLAHVWNGGPWHEAPFPYGFSLAYLFAAAGYIYRLFLLGPGGFDGGGYQLELLLKTVFTAFAIGNGVLLYHLARDLYPHRRRAPWVVVALWLGNPAVWISAAVWGQTHVVSSFFLLAALLATIRGAPILSWTMLALAAFSRPQMVPLAIPVGLLNLRRHGVMATVSGVAWAALIVFLCMMPLLWYIGPSFPVDMALLQLRTQELGGNEAALRTISLGAHNLWVLIARLQGIEGAARFRVPVDGGLPNLTYGEAAWLLTALAGIVSCLMVAVLGRRPADWAAPLAFGAASFFVFKTGLAPTHFLLALPLLALASPLSRPLVAGSVIWGSVSAIAMLSGLADALRDVPALAPRLAPQSNLLMAWMLQLGRNDLAITVLAVANLAVLVTAALAAIVASRQHVPVHGPVPVHAGDLMRATQWGQRKP